MSIQDGLESIIHELSLGPSRVFCEDWADLKENMILAVCWGSHSSQNDWRCSGGWHFVPLLCFGCSSLAPVFMYILLPVTLVILPICAAWPQVQGRAQHCVLLFPGPAVTLQMEGWTRWPSKQQFCEYTTFYSWDYWGSHNFSWFLMKSNTNIFCQETLEPDKIIFVFNSQTRLFKTLWSHCGMPSAIVNTSPLNGNRKYKYFVF